MSIARALERKFVKVSLGVTDDEENVTDEFRIVQEVEQEGKKFVKDIHDPQLINLLAKYLKPVVEGE